MKVATLFLESMMTDAVEQKSSPALIAAAWLLVVLPTAWGLTYTVENALKIFTKAAPATSAPAKPPGAPPATR